MQRWLRAYSELLNTWRLYHARCALDIAVAAKLREAAALAAPLPPLPKGGERGGGGLIGGPPFLAPLGSLAALVEPSAQVFARCGFCRCASAEWPLKPL